MDSRLENVSIVVAVAENNVIGRDGDIPWKLRSDLRRFKNLTVGHNVIMGRKTFESIVRRLGGPLPDRTNIVLTRQADYRANGAQPCESLEEALALCRPNRHTFIIGGAEIYQQALPLVNRIHATIVHANIEGDATIPYFTDWTMSYLQRFPKDERNEHDYTFAVCERRPQPSAVYLTNAREVDQWLNMEQIFVANVCPFCPEHLPVYHPLPNIRETEHWVLTANQYPYKNTRVHFLLIRRHHAESLGDLGSEDWRDLGELVGWTERTYGIEGGGFGLRFGNPAVNGATVKHLHAHLLTAQISDRNHPDYQPVRLRVG